MALSRFQIQVALGVIVLLFVVGAILYAMPSMSKNKLPELSENFEDSEQNCVGYTAKSSGSVPEPSEPLGHNAGPKSLMSDDEDPTKNNSTPKDCFPKDHLNPKDLLPNEATTKWAQTNPSGQGSIGDQNFLSAGYHTGINTVGQSMRNANLQLRSEPPNPQKLVSPWLQSTIDPDLNRKPLEIGCD